jgi:hypothetical protein
LIFKKCQYVLPEDGTLAPKLTVDGTLLPKHAVDGTLAPKHVVDGTLAPKHAVDAHVMFVLVKTLHLVGILDGVLKWN